MPSLQNIRRSDVVLSIFFAPDERFDVDYYDRSYDGSRRGREDGAPLVVRGLRVSVDLVTGDTSVKALGSLRNKDGQEGSRDREQFLQSEQIHADVRSVISDAVTAIRNEIAEFRPVTY